MDAQLSIFAARISIKPRHIMLVAAMVATAPPAVAAWATSYQSVTPLSSGVDRFAADLSATADGGVLAVYDKIDGDEISQLARFSANGDLQWKTNLATQADVDNAGKYQIIQSDGSNFVGMQYVVPIDQPIPTPVLQEFHLDGSLEAPRMEEESLFLGGLNGEDGLAHIYLISPWNQYLLALAPLYPDPAYSASTNTDGQEIMDFTAIRNPVAVTDSYFAYTYRLKQLGRRSQVRFGVFEEDVPGGLFNVLVSEQGTAIQSAPSLTEIGENVMVNWIAEIAGNRYLYTRVLGVSVSEAAEVLPHIDDYVATSSTLGVPVFAAVQRPSPDPAEMDTLIGGLINPTTGDTAALTIASAPDIKVKSLRQETNGDFSLVYSISEGGTNLLKVRRISGTTAGTLWETTVADLGIAPDERIKRYPNTFVSGNDAGVLYILTRYDQPYTHNTVFNLVRLRADGQLGGG